MTVEIFAILIETLKISLTVGRWLLVRRSTVAHQPQCFRNFIDRSYHTLWLFVPAPVSGIICERFSHRASVVFGGLFLAAGTFVSSFSINIVSLYWSCGLLSGESSSKLWNLFFLLQNQSMWFQSQVVLITIWGCSTALNTRVWKIHSSSVL